MILQRRTIFVGLIVLVSLAGPFLTSAEGQDENPPERLLTPDQYFVALKWGTVMTAYSNRFKDYEVCCTIFPDKLAAIDVVVEDFKEQSLGDINDYGLTIGETSGLYIVDVSPRYGPCDPSDEGCDEDGVPYVPRPLIAYVYRIDKKTLQIKAFYDQR